MTLEACHTYRLATQCLECRSLMKEECVCVWKEGVLGVVSVAGGGLLKPTQAVLVYIVQYK